jgi:hypothetical protein
VENQRAIQKRKRRRKRLSVLIAVGSLVAIVVLAIVVDSARYYNKVHTGVKVASHALKPPPPSPDGLKTRRKAP